MIFLETQYDQLANWLNVDQNAQTIANVIISGGIPLTWYTTSIVQDRVWVRLTIDATYYLLDPAFKSYTVTNGINLEQALGYNRTNLLGAAANGATIATDSVRNMNEPAFVSQLEQYASNLADVIKNQYPNSSVLEIIGGRTINKQYLTQLPATLPFTTSNEIYWDDDVPEQYTATLRIQHVGIDHTFNVPDITGRRLTLTYDGINNLPELRLDGVVTVTGNATTLGTKYDMVLSIDHPYANGNGQYCDQMNVTFHVESGSTYAIVADFGGTTDAVISYRQEYLNTSMQDGLSDTSERVLGETLNIMGLTWMKETLLADRLLRKLTDTVAVRHHTIGLMAQEAGYYIDIPMAVTSVLSQHNIEADRKAHFYASALISSGFEHGMLEQLMGSDNPGASTIKLLQIANSSNNFTYQANSGNYSSIRPLLVNYSTSQLDSFQSQVNSGQTLIIPGNGQLILGQWQGLTYLARHESATSMSLGLIIGGNYYGGYSSTEGNASPTVVSQTTLATTTATPSPATISNIVNTTPAKLSQEPVDMASGAYIFNHIDLTLGSNAPWGLTFNRSYSSSRRENTGMGYGWSHNYDVWLEESSNGDPGLGLRSPLDMVPMIAAMYTNIDLLKNEDTLQGWMTASLTDKWAIDQLIDNVVTVHLGSKSMQFVKQPEGSYTAPPGLSISLEKNGSLFQLNERFDTTLAFNADNRLSSWQDSDGNQLNFTYSSDKLSTVEDSFSRTLLLGYTDVRISSVTDSTGRVTNYGYDPNGDLISFTDTDDKIWQYGYDTGHQMTSLTNPLGIITATNSYNLLGQVVQQTVPRQNGENAIYNFYFSGFRNVEEDPDGNQLIYYFDHRGRSIADENQLGHSVNRIYDGQDHTVEITDARGNGTTFSYDGDHNILSTVDPLDNETFNLYDSLHRLTEIIDPLTHKVNFAYDAEHHLTTTTAYPTSGESIVTGISYYDNGQVHTDTDGRGFVNTATYDSNGLPKTSKLDTEPEVAYSYDAIGRMTSLTDQSGNVTSFTYDNRGLITSSTDPFNRTTTYTHYDDGMLHTVTDRNSHTTTWIYSVTGKIDTISYHDASSVNFTYDQHDRLTAMNDNLGTTSYSYDQAGQLISVTDPHGFIIGYNYDENGNISEITYPDDHTSSYTYDALNRLETVSFDSFSPIATYSYDDAGRLNSQTHNGTETVYGYDDANRLTSLVNRRIMNGEVISSQNFILDGNGNRISEERIGPVKSAVGLDSLTSTFAKNRLQTAGSLNYTQDNEGQRTLHSGGVNYTFDANHRLTAISGTDNISYLYSGSSNRLQSNHNGSITRYIYDAGGNLLAEADENNSIIRRYIYGLGLLALHSDSGLYFYQYDALGNTVALTDYSGEVVNHYAYSPFGVLLNQYETFPQPFKYVGKYGVMAEENGLYYMRARYYDPQVGRFMSEDPLGFGGGDVNLYNYALNNPVMYSDPTGQFIFSSTAAAYFFVIAPVAVRYGPVIARTARSTYLQYAPATTRVVRHLVEYEGPGGPSYYSQGHNILRESYNRIRGSGTFTSNNERPQQTLQTQVNTQQQNFSGK